MNNLSNQPEKSPQTALNEVYMGDNPTTITHNIILIEQNMIHRKALMSKYNLLYGSYDLLVMITSSWLLRNEAISVYGLSGVRQHTIASTYITITGLLNKGLIEIAGYGKHRCNLYVPSRLALAEFTPVE
jgi:hypothetical protein